MTHNTSPTSNDAPDGWGDLKSLLAQQPRRGMSPERQAALIDRVERTIAVPRPLHRRPAVRRGVFATGTAMALLATVWFTGVFEGDAPAPPTTPATVQSATQPTKPRRGLRNRPVPRPIVNPPAVAQPAPVTIDTPTNVTQPQPTTGTTTDPQFTPGPRPHGR